MAFLALALTLVCAVGLIWPRPLSFMGMERRWQYLALGFGSFIAIGALAPKADSSSPSSVAKPAVAPDTGSVEVGSMSWRKDGFGSVMIGSFSILNSKPYSVKDVQVRCEHAANSGTVIDSNTRAIYEIVGPRSQFWAHDLNMGFIHSQASSTKCKVIDFSRI